MRTLGICVVAALLVMPGCKKKDEAGKNKPRQKTVQPKQKPVTKTPVKAKNDTKLVDRGRYLAGLSGCVGCHTRFTAAGMPDMKKAYAGGFEITEVFGTWRSTNITSDKKTGIGSWTDQEIVDAIRTGKRKDGTMMYPIMPYMSYNKLSDGDAKALVAFLRTIPAVENAVAGNDKLKLPKPPGPLPVKNAPVDMKDPLKKGAYLATLMHCDMCHTPMTPKGPNMTKIYAGGLRMDLPEKFAKVMGSGYVYASNITQDEKTGIGNWSEAEIRESFTQFVKKDGKPINGPMNMYRRGWGSMPPDDATAVAKFIKSIKAISNKVPPSKFKSFVGPPPRRPAKEMGGGRRGGHKHGSGMGGGRNRNK